MTTTSTQGQKLITISEQERGMIYYNQLEQHNPTREETEAYFSVCEAYGLNPLMGDIVFQKRFVKKTNKAVASYIVTRDGHYKYALRQPNFVKLISYVVCEGDHFEIDAIAGVPKHKFGANRGKKIGAWAMIEDKVRGCMATFVEFDEYFEANKSNHIWHSMPSAMIKKVAQVEALRMAFPLGIHFRTEFESESEGVIDLNTDLKDVVMNTPKQSDTQNTPSAEPALLFTEEELKAKQEEVNKRKQADEGKELAPTKKKASKKDLTNALLDGEKPAAEKLKQEKPQAEQPTADIVQEEVTSDKGNKKAEKKEVIEKPVESKPTDAASTPVIQEEVTEPEVKANESVQPIDQDDTAGEETDTELVYEFVSSTVKRSRSSQELFLQIETKVNGEIVELIAKGDVMDDFDQMEPSQQFTAEVISLHGFTMVKSIVLAG